MFGWFNNLKIRSKPPLAFVAVIALISQNTEQTLRTMAQDLQKQVARFRLPES